MSHIYPLCGVIRFPRHNHHIEGTVAFSVSSERHWQSGVNGNAEVPKWLYHDSNHGPLGRQSCARKPDRAISGSYDWLRLGQGATDRQCLLRCPAAVAYRDRSLRVVELSRTIGEYRRHEEIVRLVLVINDLCTIIDDGRPMIRSIDRCILRPIVRAIVASCDRS